MLTYGCLIKKKKKSNYEIRNWLKYLKLILRIESQKITKIVAKMFNGAKISNFKNHFKKRHFERIAKN